MLTNNEQSYGSLSDIRMRKEQLRNDILKDDQKIKDLWGNIFHKPDVLRKDIGPSKRAMGLINTGAGLLDGLLLGWKLYKKFKK